MDISVFSSRKTKAENGERKSLYISFYKKERKLLYIKGRICRLANLQDTDKVKGRYEQIRKVQDMIDIVRIFDLILLVFICELYR